MAEFGTDGFRGKANSFSYDGLKRIGEFLAKDGFAGDIVIGYDTRESSNLFRNSIVSGINNANSKAIDLGIVTTPTVAYFSKVIPSAKYGIMITASHNPYYDNGIKIFKLGNKISSDLESKLIEVYNFSTLSNNIEPNFDFSTEVKDPSNYLRYISRGFDLKTIDKKIILDSANGGASNLSKRLFSENNYIHINNNYDGRNINENCGIIHPKNLQKKVLAENAYLGICFDGDCDRVGFIDEMGEFIDGDYLLAFLATDMLKKGQLKKNTFVVTHYSNLALDSYIQKIGGKVIRVENGDKAVFAKLREDGLNFGGEKLGHILFGDYLGSSDGFLIAKEVLSRLDYNKTISEQFRVFDLHPQIILNVPVIKKTPLNEISGLEDIIRIAKKELNGSGRIFVRYSGTENYCRVMLEGKDEVIVNAIGNEIKSKIELANM